MVHQVLTADRRLPGSFDPLRSPSEVMERASRSSTADVGVGINIEKGPSYAGRTSRVDPRATTHLKNVEIRASRLAVAFVKQCGARIMVRGVRPITDIAAELTMMMANRGCPDVETLFMIADGELAHVSSSLISKLPRWRATRSFSASCRRTS